MEKKIVTFYFGEVTLCECFDADTSVSGEGYVEATNTEGLVIAEIFGYDIDDIDEDVIEEFLL